MPGFVKIGRYKSRVKIRSIDRMALSFFKKFITSLKINYKCVNFTLMLGKFASATVILFFIIILSSGGAFAQNGEEQPLRQQPIQIEYEKVNPSDGFNYGLKRFKEKLYLTLLFYSKNKKIDYYSRLVTRRLAELKYIVENKDMANFENATTRYFATVGQFADFLTKNGTADQKSGTVRSLSSHIFVLENLRDTFEGQEKAEWRFIQDDINYTTMYMNQLK